MKPFESISTFFRRNIHHDGLRPNKKTFLIIFFAGLSVLLVVGIVFVLFPYLIQVLWAWIVPELFPGAVRQGILAGSISWLTGFKVFIGLLVLGTILNGVKGNIQMDHGNGKKGDQDEPVRPVVLQVEARAVDAPTG